LLLMAMTYKTMRLLHSLRSLTMTKSERGK
jgi:hypothetical protein